MGDKVNFILTDECNTANGKRKIQFFWNLNNEDEDEVMIHVENNESFTVKSEIIKRFAKSISQLEESNKELSEDEENNLIKAFSILNEIKNNEAN